MTLARRVAAATSDCPEKGLLGKYATLEALAIANLGLEYFLLLTTYDKNRTFHGLFGQGTSSFACRFGHHRAGPCLRICTEAHNRKNYPIRFQDLRHHQPDLLWWSLACIGALPVFFKTGSPAWADWVVCSTSDRDQTQHKDFHATPLF